MIVPIQTVPDSDALLKILVQEDGNAVSEVTKTILEKSLHVKYDLDWTLLLLKKNKSYKKKAN